MPIRKMVPGAVIVAVAAIVATAWTAPAKKPSLTDALKKLMEALRKAGLE